MRRAEFFRKGASPIYLAGRFVRIFRLLVCVTSIFRFFMSSHFSVRVALGIAESGEKHVLGV